GRGSERRSPNSACVDASSSPGAGMIRRRSAWSDLPERLRRFDPAEWPSVTDPSYKPGTAYGEALRLWDDEWDRWQGGDPTVAAAEYRKAHEAAWRDFPDDPFSYDED